MKLLNTFLRINRELAEVRKDFYKCVNYGLPMFDYSAAKRLTDRVAALEARLSTDDSGEVPAEENSNAGNEKPTDERSLQYKGSQHFIEEQRDKIRKAANYSNEDVRRMIRGEFTPEETYGARTVSNYLLRVWEELLSRGKTEEEALSIVKLCVPLQLRINFVDGMTFPNET